MRELKINPIRSLDKAIDILNVLSEEKDWLTIDEIVELTKMPKTTVYRILYTLELRGLIRYDRLLNRYHLGFKLLEYSDSVTESIDLLRDSVGYLMELYKKVRQTVLLAMVEDDSIVYIFKKEKKTEGLTYTSSVGKRRHLLYGALGRVALAFMPPEKREKILEEPLPQWTPHSTTDKEELLEQLQQIKTELIFTEMEEAQVGVMGIASPIFNVHGENIAVLGIVCPRAAMSDALIEEAKQLCKETAKLISFNIGYKEN